MLCEPGQILPVVTETYVLQQVHMHPQLIYHSSVSWPLLMLMVL
jgi:hypothetical protein